MASVETFHEILKSSNRILAICGAGLSAASGLPTFRGAGGLWRNYEATELATPQAFRRDPSTVWQFYAYRRHMALSVKPNAGHEALAALAKVRKEGFLCVTQNVDNLHERAGHPTDYLRHLHGSLFNVKCSKCSWNESNEADPLVPALGPASRDAEPGKLLPLLDPAHKLASIPPGELPLCPKCNSLARPGVVWFGENLDMKMLDDVDRWIEAAEVDLVLVIGTSSVVYPAAGYAEVARGRNTRVVTVNLEPEHVRAGDMAFAGDASVLLPDLLAPVIGDSK